MNLNKIKITDHSCFFTTISLVIFLGICSCNSGRNTNESQELDINQKEPGGHLFENQSSRKNGSIIDSTYYSVIGHHKKLRYLYVANGGIIAYFDDSTYTACSRCDFSKSNISSMFNVNQNGTYLIQENGSLLLNNGNIEMPAREISEYNGWALINYKWYKFPAP